MSATAAPKRVALYLRVSTSGQTANKEATVQRLLAAGTGIVKTAKLAGVGVSAVQRIKAK